MRCVPHDGIVHSEVVPDGVWGHVTSTRSLRMAVINFGLHAVWDRRSTEPPSLSSRLNLRPMKVSKVAGVENSTKKSQSLLGCASPRDREPKSQAWATPKRRHSSLSEGNGLESFDIPESTANFMAQEYHGLDPSATHGYVKSRAHASK
jgi:hypothetical protein